MDSLTPTLPSMRTLLLSTAGAAGVAGILLLTAILPAEYGIDPTGVGKILGLTQLAPGYVGPEPETEASTQSGGFREDVTAIDIPAGQELEYKLRITSGALLDYAWQVDQGMIYSDLHGEPVEGAGSYAESFLVGRAQSTKGSLEAPFEGLHGWYWKNENAHPVRVTLRTRGIYTVVGKLGS